MSRRLRYKLLLAWRVWGSSILIMPDGECVEQSTA